MGMIFLRVSLLCLLLLPFGCSQEQPAQKVNLAKREKIEIRKEENIVTYAYLPQYSHRVSYKRHHLLIEYLREETGLPITVTEDPLSTVVLGTGKALDSIEILKQVVIT